MAHAVMQLADSITKAKLAKHLVREQVPPTKEFVHEVISDVGSSPTVSQGYPTPGASDSYEPTYRVTPPRGTEEVHQTMCKHFTQERGGFRLNVTFK